MAVLSIDLGTTGCKAGIFDGGRILGLANRRSGYASPEVGWAQQDAEEAWSLLRSVIREALAAARPRPRIEAVCLSVQGDAIIPVDREGRALHPAILGMDIRSHREASDLEARFGREQLYEWTGMPCEPLNAITKIFWLERNRPELKRSLWKYVHYEEFLLAKLAGAPALDFTMASRTMAFDPVGKRWVEPVLDAVGIGPERLGDPCPAGVVVGSIVHGLAGELGIDRDALVVSGAHDQCMAGIGSGVIEPGLATWSMGTAEVICAAFAEPRKTRGMLGSNYPCYCHAVDGQYYTISLNQSGGISLEWLLGLFLGPGEVSEEARGAAYAEAISRLRVEPSPVLFIPHLVGSGTPTCNHRARGAFLDLALKANREDLFQAVVEALAFEARLNRIALEKQGIAIDELRAVGGGTRSRKVLEIKATILDRPIRTLEVSEAALLGAALEAQVAVGKFRDIQGACAGCVRIAETVEPVRAASGAYEEAFERYRRAYGGLQDFHGEGRKP